MLCHFLPMVPWQPLRILLTSVVQRGVNIAQTDWQRSLRCWRDEFKSVQDWRMERSARWIMSGNCCQLSFFYICRDGVEEHQHIHTSGAFKCPWSFCLCSTELQICALKGLKFLWLTAVAFTCLPDWFIPILSPWQTNQSSTSHTATGRGRRWCRDRRHYSF